MCAFFPGTCLRLGPCICFIKETWLSIHLLILLEEGVHQSQNAKTIFGVYERVARTGLIKDLPTNKQHPSYWTKYRISRLRNSVRKALAKTYLGGNSSFLSHFLSQKSTVRFDEMFGRRPRHHARKRGNEAAWCTGILSCLQTDKLINRTDWEKKGTRRNCFAFNDSPYFLRFPFSNRKKGTFSWVSLFPMWIVITTRWSLVITYAMVAISFNCF